MSNGLISDQRASNLVDMAYLFYLPFARVFVSQDKLHQRVVPLFLTNDQVFVWGPDLKSDLAKADGYFAGLSKDERAKGLFLLANEPPPPATLISNHWDKFLSGWRERKPIPPPPKNSELHKRLLGDSNAFIDAAAARQLAADPASDPDHLIIQRHIPRKRGKWRMFSAEVEAQEDSREEEKPRPQK